MRRSINKTLIIVVALLLCIAIMIVVKSYPNNQTQSEECLEEEQEMDAFIDHSPLNGLSIKDNVSVYANDIDDSVKHVYITALSTIEEETGETVTLSDINQMDQYYDDYNPEIQIIFQEGDENGPFNDVFTPQVTQGNAIMRARGYSARRSSQKSFKIKLNDNTALFLDQSTLNMNKHYYDKLRITNKLCFDLFETIPNFTSMRTQFVNIHIKDAAQGDHVTYQNYGLFTMIEQPNKQFLESHNLDKNGNLYKAQYFTFTTLPELLNESDPEYNKKEFEKVLEIEEGKDHTKLLNMIKDVENTSLNIDDVVEEHFNRDNYITWMALNIMLGNIDATVSNYLLYSPVNSKTWYFLPWDYDGSLYYSEYKRLTEQQYPETQYGLGLFWGISLHQRFYKNPANVEELSEKIQDLRDNYITTKRVNALSQSYISVIKTYATKTPDINHLQLTVNQTINEINNIDDIIDGNINRYFKNLENPMPIWMDKARINEDGSVSFQWESAYDLQGDQVTYQLQIARDIDFNYLVFDSEEQIENHYTLNMELAPDKYYYRVIIHDEKGHTQLSMEEICDDEGNMHRGLLAFEVQ